MKKQMNHSDLIRTLNEMGMIGEVQQKRLLDGNISIYAQTDYPVLITGETGTGKEVLAKVIHYLSRRPKEIFVPVDCSSIPNTLIESELFGYARGAFTGATSHYTGLIEQAHKGTLFLDEIGDVPLSTQVKLLRVLQDKSVRKTGVQSGNSKIVNFRLICATNLNLEELIKKGRFREDLYWRISDIEQETLPLRNRRQDIAALSKFIITKEITEQQFDISPQVTKQVLKKLSTHSWLGNIRELTRVLRRALILTLASPKKIIEEKHIITTSVNLNQNINKINLEEGFNYHKYKRSDRDKLFQKAIQESNTDKEAAEKLGITPPAVSQYKKKLNKVNNIKYS